FILLESFALSVLKKMGGTTSGDWCKQICIQRNRQVPERTFQNWRASLVGQGFVKVEGEVYVLTETGMAAASGTPGNATEPRPSEAASHATTPLGVAGRHEGGTQTAASEEYLRRDAAIQGAL